MANLTTNPYSSTQDDGVTLQNDFTGSSGEKLVSDTHGRFYNLSKRGKLFAVSSVAAGAAPPLFSATGAAAATFGIWNRSSTSNLELLQYNAGFVPGTIALGSIGYNILTNAGFSIGTGAAVVSFTATAPVNLNPSCGIASQSTGFTTANLTAAGTFIHWTHIGRETATACVGPTSLIDNIEGRIIVGPGQMFYTVGSIAQTAPVTQTLLFAEIPV